MTCPLLDEKQNKCKAIRTHRIDYATNGKQIRIPNHKQLNQYEVAKCKTLWRNCPDYKTAKIITCQNCGHTYLPEEGTLVTYKNQTLHACPNCGNIGVKR
jgi:predicted RNA-binding Zn-ribbon protein involved in translation (DUF1610 family)